VWVHALHDTTPPETIEVVPIVMYPPEVATVTSMIVADPLVRIRANVAVPVATAVPEVIAFAVITPPEVAEPKAGLPKVSVQSSVFPESAVFALTGCVPE
jgi:hypothetical protein